MYTHNNPDVIFVDLKFSNIKLLTTRNSQQNSLLKCLDIVGDQLINNKFMALEDR